LEIIMRLRQLVLAGVLATATAAAGCAAPVMTTAQLIYGRNFQQIPLLIVASIWYLVLTTVLTYVQSRIERRMSRGMGAVTRKRIRLPIGGR
jgi:ABC-type amino acid transport system permease subunit